MNIFCDSNGVIFHVIPEKIFQGSAGVNKVYFIGQFPSSAQVLMAYTLPNGIPTTPKMLVLNKQMEEVQAPNGGKFSVWEGIIGASPKIADGQVVKDDSGNVIYDLDFTITENYGIATMQFYVYGASNRVIAEDTILNVQGGLLATASVNFTIEKGVPVVLPVSLDEEGDVSIILAQILNALANTQMLYSNTIEEIERVSTNASEESKAYYERNKADIDANKTDIEGLRSDIQNEAHFRGYLQTNAEVQALQGTPNDYAYSAESGTVWIYQNGAWVNSGKPVPDQMTPASNTTPLMDGTASAGQEGAYARGDHRHPTDTSRLAASEKGQANGVASLNASGKVPESQLPPMAYLPLSGGKLTGNLEVDGKTAYTSEGATLSEASLRFAFGATSGKSVAYKVDGVYYTYNGTENVIMLFPTNKSGTQTFAMLSDLASLETQVALHSQIIAQSGLMYTADNVSSWNERVTANGLNVLDGSKAVLKKVVGSTVACKNLFDKNSAIDGYEIINILDGTLGVNAEWFTTNYIPVRPNTTYVVSGKPNGSAVIAYNSNKVVIKDLTGGGNGRFTTTEDTAFVRLNGYLIQKDTFQIEEGSTATEYQPYFTGLKSASFAGIESTNADGTETSTFAFPKTETPLGVTIDFENKKITDYGVEIVLTGTETFSYYGAKTSISGNPIFYPSIYVQALPNAENRVTNAVSTDGIIPKSDREQWQSNTFWIGVNNKFLYWMDILRILGFTNSWVDEENPTTEEQATAIASLKSYLSQRYADGNPVTIRYVSSTLQSETNFTTQQSASGNEYTAYKGGTETVLDNNGNVYGADNTMTINYVFVSEVQQ